MDQQRAMQQVGQLDREFLRQLILGSLQTAGLPAGEAQQQAADRAAAIVNFISTNAAIISPDLIDQLGGSRGLAVNMARGVTEGLRFTRYGSRAGGEFTQGLYRELFPAAGVRDTNGLNAGTMGRLFDELTRRGLLSMATDRQQITMLSNTRTQDGRTVAERLQRGESIQNIVANEPELSRMVQQADIRQAARALEEWSGAVAAVRDLLQAYGRPSEDMGSIFQVMDNLTQGATRNMSPGHIQSAVRRAHQLARNTPGGLDRYLENVRQSGQLAEQFGLNRGIAADIAMRSTAFSTAWARTAGRQGAGGLTAEDASTLNMQLMAAAAGSPMANALGAIMRLHASGQIRGGPAMQLVESIRSRDMRRLNQYATMTPSQLQRLAENSGVPAGLFVQFLQNQADNMDAAEHASIPAIVRQMQGQGEISQLMRFGLQTGIGSTLRGTNLDEATLQRVRRVASEAVRQALMNMRGDELSSQNPDTIARRNQALAMAIRTAIDANVGPNISNQIGQNVIERMAVASYESLGAFMRRNPGLSRFRNIAGLVTMNSGEVFDAMNENIHRAGAEGDVASITTGLNRSPLVARIVDTIAGAGPDTNLQRLISEALGGVSSQQLLVALESRFQLIRQGQADRRAGRDTEAARMLRHNIDSVTDLVNQVQVDRLAAQLNPDGTAVQPPPQPAGLPPGQPPPNVQPPPGAAPANPQQPGIIDRVWSGIRNLFGGQAEAQAPAVFQYAWQMPRRSSWAASRRQQLQRLAARDREVRAQETLHWREAGDAAMGPPRYTWQTGPDGRNYAVGGSVTMDLSGVRGDPRATQERLARVQRAAMAPASVSGAGEVSQADRSVAMQAEQMSQMLSGASRTVDSSTGANMLGIVQSPAEFQHGDTGDDVAPNLLTTISQSAPVAARVTMPEAKQKSQTPTRITGTLTIRADGMTADLDALPDYLDAAPPAF